MRGFEPSGFTVVRWCRRSTPQPPADFGNPSPNNRPMKAPTHRSVLLAGLTLIGVAASQLPAQAGNPETMPWEFSIAQSVAAFVDPGTVVTKGLPQPRPSESIPRRPTGGIGHGDFGWVFLGTPDQSPRSECRSLEGGEPSLPGRSRWLGCGRLLSDCPCHGPHSPHELAIQHRCLRRSPGRVRHHRGSRTFQRNDG